MTTRKEIQVEGWIKLHRSLEQSPIFCDPNLLKVWIWCLFKASHETRTIVVGHQAVTLETGQFVTGRKKAAEALGLKESTAYRYLQTLEEFGSIEMEATNKFTVISVINWDYYQSVLYEP